MTKKSVCNIKANDFIKMKVTIWFINRLQNIVLDLQI